MQYAIIIIGDLCGDRIFLILSTIIYLDDQSFIK